MARFVVGACPKCDFDAQRAHTPVLCENGLRKCEHCGTAWRSLGSAKYHAPRDRHVPQHFKNQQLQAEPRIAGELLKPGIVAAANTVAARLSVERSGLIALALLFGIAMALSLQSGKLAFPAAFSRPSVEITSLVARQLQRDGQIAVQVEGRIVNRSRQRVEVGEVNIVLTEAKGHRVFSWKHRPAIAFLEPGASFRFSTANGSVPQMASSVEISSGEAHSTASL